MSNNAALSPRKVRDKGGNSCENPLQIKTLKQNINQGSVNFLCKEQTINILGFVARLHQNTPRCYYDKKEVIDDV